MTGDGFTLGELGRLVSRLERAIEGLEGRFVHRELHEANVKELDRRLRPLERWVEWAQRIVIGAVLTGGLSALGLHRAGLL